MRRLPLMGGLLRGAVVRTVQRMVEDLQAILDTVRAYLRFRVLCFGVGHARGRWCTECSAWWKAGSRVQGMTL